MTEIVGSCQHYSAFVELCRRRIEELDITAATVDRIAEFPERYTGTLLSRGKTMSVYSLFAVAGALGLQPLFVHEPIGSPGSCSAVTGSE